MSKKMKQTIDFCRKLYFSESRLFIFATIFICCIMNGVAYSQGQKVTATHKIINLTSPWGFPQYYWAENGIHSLSDPASEVSYPGWEFELKTLKDQVDFYHNDWGFNVFRILCQKPLHHIYHGTDVTTLESWEKIMEVVEYIESKNSKVIISFCLGWQWNTEADIWNWSPANTAYFQSIPQRLLDDGPSGLRPSVLYYEIDNEGDFFLFANKSSAPDNQGLNPDALVNWVTSNAPARIQAMGVMVGNANYQLLLRGVPWTKLSFGAWRVEGAYLINRAGIDSNNNGYQDGLGSTYTVLNYHQGFGYSELMDNVNWIRSKSFGSGNNSHTFPIIISETLAPMHWWAGLPLTGNSGWNRRSKSPEQYQSDIMTGTFQAYRDAVLQGKNIPGIGIWASCDITFQYNNPSLQGDEHLVTDNVWAPVILYMDSWTSVATIGTWRTLIMPRKVMYDVHNYLNY